MRIVTSEHARDYLRTAFAVDFMRGDQTAREPIWFPGFDYAPDGTLSVAAKLRATEHLIEAFARNGYLLKFDNEIDVTAALHHVLWDPWTKEEAGNGRFTGRMFDDYGHIYLGHTADDAARHTIERLSALAGRVLSYTVQEDGGPVGSHTSQHVLYLAANGTLHAFVATVAKAGVVWVPAWLGATESALRWIRDELEIPTSALAGPRSRSIFRVPRDEWDARIDSFGRQISR